MPFPKRLLLDGETVALDLRPHWWYFAGPLFAGIPVLALLIVAMQQNGDVQTAGLWVTVAVALAWAVWLGARLISWQTTHFVVTSDRLVFRSGILAKHTRDIPLEKVNDLASSQTFFERMIGAGDLLIESAGERGQETFSDIPHPNAVQQEIYRQMEINQNRMMGGGAPPQQSVTDQIAALADLLDRGAISSAEYEAKKAQLLDRM
ncbi:MAG TPA: PH domain-containing protein [Acidimicrobiia bacterium]|jgi:membrane protein YdbS with pleckstrin-like domain|nr:PH domain-containing protein [Acidimicrobiia bacterium]